MGKRSPEVTHELVRDSLNSAIAACASAKAFAAGGGEKAILAAIDVAAAHLRAARGRLAGVIFDNAWVEGQEEIPGL